MPKAAESVDHPAHYGGDTDYEAIKVIEAWNLDFCLGNALKYISRAGKKDAHTEAEDLRKAAWYLNRRIAQIEAKAATALSGKSMRQWIVDALRAALRKLH